MPDDHFGQQKKKFKQPTAKLTFRGKNDGIVIFLTFGIKEKLLEPNGVGKRIKARFSLLFVSRFYTEVTKPINDFTSSSHGIGNEKEKKIIFTQFSLMQSAKYCAKNF